MFMRVLMRMVCAYRVFLRAHVNEHVHDDVRSRARGGGHVDGDDDQVTSVP